MQGNGGRENHIRDVSPCELFGRTFSIREGKRALPTTLLLNGDLKV
jgi:hypothetical protein